MSPESGRMTGTLIEEARAIKDALLEVQYEVREVADETESRLSADIRERLGYTEAPAVITDDLIDTRIQSSTLVITPRALANVLPLSAKSAETVRDSRKRIAEIMFADDGRLVVVAGPCSIHDPEVALEYAAWIKEKRAQYGEDLEIVMRAYMEKPRTELGWKGLVYDPDLDDSNDINLGLVMERMLVCQITNMGVPIAMERLNANTPQYVNGMVSNDTIGARNTTDQKAREYASGTSSPVGFKNTPEGSVEAAVSAVVSANAPHTFHGMDMSGMPMQVTTTGNDMAYVILRGDQQGPNYSGEQITRTRESLRARGLSETIMIDASHGNSRKDYRKQLEVIEDVGRQISLGELSIRGVMIESNLVEGNQKLEDVADLAELEYGKSITDACVGLAETNTMFSLLAKAVRARRQFILEQK